MKGLFLIAVYFGCLLHDILRLLSSGSGVTGSDRRPPRDRMAYAPRLPPFFRNEIAQTPCSEHISSNQPR